MNSSLSQKNSELSEELQSLEILETEAAAKEDFETANEIAKKMQVLQLDFDKNSSAIDSNTHQRETLQNERLRISEQDHLWVADLFEKSKTAKIKHD